MTLQTIKCILLIMLMGTWGSAEELKLLPLSEKVVIFKEKNPDPSEVAYIGIRCSSLYGVMAGWLIENGNGESDTEYAKQFLELAKPFRIVSVHLNLTVNKMNAETMLSQQRALVKAYADEMIRGKQLNNNRFTPFVKADIETAKAISRIYEELAKAITAKDK